VSNPILRTKTRPAKELAQNKLYLRYFSLKQTSSLSPTILFSKTFYKKVLIIKSACAVLALYINRFASRFIVADKSGRQIAACKLALSLGTFTPLPRPSQNRQQSESFKSLSIFSRGGRALKGSGIKHIVEVNMIVIDADKLPLPFALVG